VGYEALDEVGLAEASRFDTAFFCRMLDDGEQGKQARHVWKRFLQALRRCPSLRVKERATVVLNLDGVSLVAPSSHWVPWRRGDDQTPNLEKRLRSLGQAYGLMGFKTISDRVAVQCYVITHHGFQLGDLFACVGGACTRIWEIYDPSRGSMKSLDSAVGIRDFIETLDKTDGLDESVLRALLLFLQQPDRLDDFGARPRLEVWQKEKLFPGTLTALRKMSAPQAASARRLWIGGEGASLLAPWKDRVKHSDAVRWAPDTLYLPAYGAAVAAHQYHIHSSEE